MEAATASLRNAESPYFPRPEPASHQEPPPPSLGCVGVWSGNREAVFKGKLPGLATWVYSALFESSTGGDVHYVSVCDEGRLSRIALADVSGHGAGVGNVAQLLLGLMHRYINTWDQSDMMRDLGGAFGQAQHDSQYATAIVLGFHHELGQIAYTNAGHPAPPLVPRRRETLGRSCSGWGAGHGAFRLAPRFDPRYGVSANVRDPGSGRSAHSLHRRHDRGQKLRRGAARGRTPS